MRKVLILLAVLMLRGTGFCVETYNPTDSVPLFVVTTTGVGYNTVDSDSLRFVWYRALESGEFEEVGTTKWTSDSTWGKIATGEIGRWIPASDAFGNPGKYQASIRAYRGDSTDAKIVPWQVKITSIDSLTFRTNPFVYDYGYIFEDFEDTSEWTVEGTDASKAPDYLHRTEGFQGIQISTASGDTAWMTKAICEWFGDEDDSCWPGNFTIAVYDTFQPKWDYSRLDSMALVFSSTGEDSVDFSKQMRVVFRQHHFCSGWNKFVVHHSDFTAYGGETWMSVMIRLRIYVYAHTGKSAVLTFDEMRYGYRSEPTVIFTFDDNMASQLPNGVRYALDPTSIKASFPIRCWSMTDALEDSFDIIYGKGHDIENQAWGGDDGGLTYNYWTHPCTVRAEVNKGIHYIYGRGWKEEPRIYAFNSGWWSKPFLDALKQTSHMARTDVNDHYQAHVELDGRQWYVKAHPIGVDTNLTRAKQIVDECRDRGSLVVFIFHGVVTESPAGSQWHRDSLKALCEYVDSLRTAEELSCMRMCDYYEALKSGAYLKTWVYDAQIKILRDSLQAVLDILQEDTLEVALVDSAIGEEKIKSLAVRNRHLAGSLISGAKIDDGAFLGAKFATDFLTKDKISTQAIGWDEMHESWRDSIPAMVAQVLSDSGYTAERASNIDAIKAKTDNLPPDPADDSDIDIQLSAIQTDLDAPAQYKATGFAVAGDPMTLQSDSLKTLAVNIDSIVGAITDANKANFKATGFSTSSDFDSMNNAIADANKPNFKASGFAVAGDPMTLQDDSLYTLMTDVDGIKAKTDNLPSDPADDSDIDVQLSSIQSDLNTPDQYKANLDSMENAITATNKANFKATDFATSSQGDSVTNAITDVNKANFKYAGGEDSVRAFLATHDSTLLELASGGASNWSDAQRDSLLDAIEDANKSNFKADVDSINNAIKDDNKPNFRATGFATADSVHGAIADANKSNFKASLDSIHNAITDANKVNFKYAGGEDSVRAFLATHDSTLLELASGGASNWSDAQRDSLLDAIEDANKSNFKADVDSINNAIKDDNKPNFRATGFATADSVHGAIADANKSNFKASLDSIHNAITDANKVNFKYVGGEDSVRAFLATHDSTLLELASGGASNWSNAQRDSLLNTIVDANKANFKATGFAVPGDTMTLKGDSLYALMTDVDAIKVKTDNLPTDPADDSDIDNQLSAIQLDLDSPSQYKATGFAVAGDAMTLQDDSLDTFMGDIDAIKAKTDNLPTDPADDSDIDAQLATIAGYLDADSSDGIDPIVKEIRQISKDIKTKTDNLPPDPADDSDIDSQLGSIQTDLNNPDQYKADVSDLSAIKAKTDNLPTDPADQSLIMAEVGNLDGWNPLVNCLSDSSADSIELMLSHRSVIGDTNQRNCAIAGDEMDLTSGAETKVYNQSADAFSDSGWTATRAGNIDYLDEAISGLDDNPWDNAKSDTASGMGDWFADWFNSNWWLTATGFATSSDFDSMNQAITDVNKSNFRASLDSMENAIVDANKANFKASGFSTPSNFDSVNQAIADANKSNFKADVSGLSTFDASSDSVMTSNPPAYKDKNTATEIRQWTWYADSVTYFDSSGTMGSGNVLQGAAAGLTSEEIAHEVYDSMYIHADDFKATGFSIHGASDIAALWGDTLNQLLVTVDSVITSTGYDVDSTLLAFLRYTRNNQDDYKATGFATHTAADVATLWGDTLSQLLITIDSIINITGYDADTTLLTFLRYIRNNQSDYKADVSGLSTFDVSSDKVTLVDSSAVDISYTANSQADYKATGFSTHDQTDVWNVLFNTGFDVGSMGDSLNNATYVQGAGSDTTAIKAMLDNNMRPWVWYADTTTWHDSIGTMGELLGTAIAEAAPVDSESVARAVWDNDIIILANRTVTASVAAGVGSKEVKIKAYESAEDSTACDNCEVKLYLVEDTDYSDLKVSNYTGNSGWSSVVSVDPDSYRVRIVHEDWTFTDDTISVADVGGTQSFYVTGTYNTIPSPESDSLTTVWGRVKDVQGNYVADAIVTIVLDMREPIVPTIYGPRDIVITEIVDTTNAEGLWSKELIPNSYISPSGTRYKITYEKEDAIIWKPTRIIIVPYSATPVNINSL